jgi:hypothetical protein
LGYAALTQPTFRRTRKPWNNGVRENSRHGGFLP